MPIDYGLTVTRHFFFTHLPFSYPLLTKVVYSLFFKSHPSIVHPQLLTFQVVRIIFLFIFYSNSEKKD